MEAVKLETVPIKEIKVPGTNIRHLFSDIDFLADSMKRHGQLVPVIINQKKELVAGERRYRAAMACGMGTILALVRDGEDRKMMTIEGIVENLHRENYPASIKLKAIAILKEYYQSTGQVTTKSDIGRGKSKSPQENFPEKLSNESGMGKSTVARKAKIGEKMSNVVAGALDTKQITEKQAEQLVRVDHETQDHLLKEVIGKNLDQTKTLIDEVFEDGDTKEDKIEMEGLPVDQWAKRVKKNSEKLISQYSIGIKREVWSLGKKDAKEFINDFVDNLNNLIELEKLLPETE